MHHGFMSALSGALASQGVATLRFQFPFMEQGSRRPDAPAVAESTVRAAVEEAARQLPGVPLFAGGKSFGGRMTSQAQAREPLPGVKGLVFVGFPLHPAGKPAKKRATHLAEVGIPMLFLQGTRDALADMGLIQQVAADLGARARLHVVDGADHAFHVLVRSGRTDEEVIQELAAEASAWMLALAPA
jgi:predicted alpha/beta-hydrolase family hydrolase